MIVFDLFLQPKKIFVRYDGKLFLAVFFYNLRFHSLPVGLPSMENSINDGFALEHLHDETLQIPCLRHAGEDGMVGALAALFDKPDVSLGVAGREANTVPQIGL